MAAKTITVDYEELQGSPQEHFPEEGFNATRTLKCAWTDRLTLAQQLKGGTFIETGTPVYYTPQAYPSFPAATVRDVGVGNFDDRVVAAAGPDVKTAAYSYAVLSVAYKTGLSGDSSNPDNPLVQERVEPFAEFLTLPAAGFKWDSTSGDPLKDEESPGKLYKGFNWVYTRLAVVNLPASLFTLIGKANADVLHSNTLDFDFAAETLLYNPPLLSRQIMADGTGAWSVEYRFSYKPQGWNRFWRAKTQTWARIFNAAGAADPYETGDFHALI